MFGFMFGLVCLFGFGTVLRHMAWERRMAWGGAWAGNHGWWGGHHRHRRGDRRGFSGFGGEGFARAGGEVIKRRLGIDDEQEGIVDHALVDLRKAVKELADELKGSRAGLAEAFRGETVDDAALASIFARHDDALARARREVVSSLKQIHAVLDADQRGRAADWIATGEHGWV